MVQTHPNISRKSIDWPPSITAIIIYHYPLFSSYLILPYSFSIWYLLKFKPFLKIIFLFYLPIFIKKKFRNSKQQTENRGRKIPKPKPCKTMQLRFIYLFLKNKYENNKRQCLTPYIGICIIIVQNIWRTHLLFYYLSL